jgi:acetoin utilization deacetylase AcuC-like enzyme
MARRLMTRTGAIYSDIYLEHDTGEHVECAARLVVIREHLERTGTWEKLRVFAPRAADVEQIHRVHALDYVFRVQRICHEGGGFLDIDTVVSPGSYDAARAAAGGVFVAIDQVMLSEVGRAFCMVRPPGHHATPTDAMGFCIFNNVALGAKYLQQQHKAGRVLIVDFDCHHGNGTQKAFYEDDSVFYFSIHRSPFYPGTGAEAQLGAGKGLGFTLNVALPGGTERTEYLRRFSEAIAQVEAKFAPEFVLVSAGFDGYAEDPIAGMGLEPEDFRTITARIVKLARKHCGGKVVSTLEGGYHLGALGECVEQHLLGMME